MYTTCLFCHSDLGTNEVIESFAVGRRLAFDAAQGRLWVICRKCERWNLTPVEERWEAVEQCERLFTQTRLRVSSDNIGLSRLSEGLELVRIGKALRPEIAAWRYGDQFGRRRRRYIIGTTAVGLAAAGILIAGPATGILAGGGFGMFQILNGLQRAARDRIVRARVAVPGRDRPAILRGKDMKRIVLATDGPEWSLRIPSGGPRNRFVAGHQEITLSGDEALRAAAAVLPGVNLKGASRTEVADAVQLLERTPDPHALFANAAHLPSSRARNWTASSGFVVVGSSGFGRAMPRLAGRSYLAAGETFLDRLPQPVRLALEMAAHEDIERRAMQGELAMLEQAWRQAEEIAAISDSMFTEDVDKKLAEIKKVSS
jgi:hypothetical protein